MITEEDIEAAVDWLRDNARKAAQARAESIYMQEYRKTLKAQIMREESSNSVAAQETRAYADERYVRHLDAMRAAIEEDEYMRWMRVAAETKVAAWQTEQANSRALEKIR
jgi:hypothetical protein